MMASRKAVLDKNKQQLLDSVNTSNKVYTNEELSILLSEQQEKMVNLESKLATSENNYTKLQQQNQNAHQTITDNLNSTNLSMYKNMHNNPDYQSNLNTVTESVSRLLYFNPETIGRPTDCEYGMVENMSLGSARTPEDSYWHFQIVFCTKINAIYTRQRINTASEDKWSSWRKY